MGYLVDTNVLLCSVDPQHPMYSAAVNAILLLLSRGEELCLVPQNLIEFWNVYTRPAQKNGLGHTPNEAQQEIERLKTFFSMRQDDESIYEQWEQLVVAYQVKGVNVHDARLVAAMLVHGLTHILTFNTKDFSRYKTEITPIHPDSVTA